MKKPKIFRFNDCIFPVLLFSGTMISLTENASASPKITILEDNYHTDIKVIVIPETLQNTMPQKKTNLVASEETNLDVSEKIRSQAPVSKPERDNEGILLKSQEKDTSLSSSILLEDYQQEYPATKSEMLLGQMPEKDESTSKKEDLTEIKNELKIDPIVATVSQRTYPPSLIFAGPSAFGPGWGDVFISLSGATAGKLREDVDGSISMGFGVGDARKAISAGLTYSIGSINNFGDTGTFNLQASRIVYVSDRHQVAVGLGWDTFAQHYKGEQPSPSGVWGAITNYYFLQPDNDVNKMPISFSFGVGGGNYRQGDASTGVFGNVGVQVAPQVGVGLGWSGVGLNLGVSVVPVPTIPLTIVATGADLTDNSEGGTIFSLAVSYGFNFTPRQ